MASLVFTPLLRGQPVELAGGSLWRKKLLPVGQVDYKGRKLQFTREYLQDLARAFMAKAYDQVPLQLADASNAHTNAVERYAGQVVDADVTDDGLYITVKPTERGHKILEENPALGVSARIIEDYARSDGQYFPAAIQHVLATLDPRIPGLGGWTAIEASNSAEIVIDLSSCRFDGQDGGLLDGLDATPAEADLLGEVLDELLEEEGALENWAENGDLVIESVLNAWLAGPADMPYGTPRLDDLANSYASAIDLSVYEPVSAAIELAQQRSEQRMVRTRMTRTLAREDYRLRGDMVSLMEAYVEVGTAGHPVEMANQGAYDAQAAIELAATGSSYGQPCGAADAYGRCASRFHDVGCSHTVEAAASYGSTPVESGAWRGVLARHSRIPLADHHGQVALDQFGLPMTASEHVEAWSGERQKEGVWLGDRSARRELISPQRRQVVGDPSADDLHGEPMPYGTRAAAAQIIAENPVLQTRRQSAEGRPFTAAENAAHARRLNHPDYRWPELERQRAQAQAAARPAVTLS
jgi:hypothetical protein